MPETDGRVADFLQRDCGCPAHAAVWAQATFPGVAQAQALRDCAAALMSDLAEIECLAPRVHRGTLLKLAVDELRLSERLVAELRPLVLRLQYETAEGELPADYMPLRDAAARVRGGVER